MSLGITSTKTTFKFEVIDFPDRNAREGDSNPQRWEKPGDRRGFGALDGFERKDCHERRTKLIEDHTLCVAIEYAGERAYFPASR